MNIIASALTQISFFFAQALYLIAITIEEVFFSRRTKLRFFSMKKKFFLILIINKII